MSIRGPRIWLGGIIVLAMIIMSVAVKYDLLPLPAVYTDAMEGHYINGDLYEYTVPKEAILESGGKSYIFIVQASHDYWLDGHYAYKTEVRELASDGLNTAIDVIDSLAKIGEKSAVVLHPLADFRDEQKVRIKRNSPLH